MSSDQTVYKVALSMMRGMTAEIASRLVDYIGNYADVFSLRHSDLVNIIGVDNAILSDSIRSQALARAVEEMKFIERNSIHARWIHDENYPSRLRQCEDAPLILYTLGNCDLNSPNFLAFVGTRHATSYGIRFIDSAVTSLKEKMGEITVVSGLAYGSDIAAHRAALKADAPTVAVLAHGLDSLYPASHRNDAINILRHGGMLVTEYPHKSQVHKGNFLARNRIIAGLCDCTIVSESAEKGGAMSTARLAGEYNREVFALPGRISDTYSAGCNKLISRHSANLVTSADDIISVMRWTPVNVEGTQRELEIRLPDEALRIIEFLRKEGDARVNDISAATGIDIGRLQGMLVDMEFDGHIMRFASNLYRLA